MLICFKINFFRKNSFRNTIRVSDSLDPDQARRFVGPGLGPNCLQFGYQQMALGGRFKMVPSCCRIFYIYPGFVRHCKAPCVSCLAVASFLLLLVGKSNKNYINEMSLKILNKINTKKGIKYFINI